MYTNLYPMRWHDTCNKKYQHIGEIEMKVSKVYTTIDAHVAGEPLRVIQEWCAKIKEKRS